MKTGFFYLDRASEKRAQQLNAHLLSNVIEDENRLSEVTVPSTVRGLAKSHKIARMMGSNGSAEASMFRAAHVARVGNRGQEKRDKRAAEKQARKMRAIAEGRISPMSY